MDPLARYWEVRQPGGSGYTLGQASVGSVPGGMKCLGLLLLVVAYFPPISTIKINNIHRPLILTTQTPYTRPRYKDGNEGKNKNLNI